MEGYNMATKIRKEGIINALFFIGAFIVLLLNTFGLLTIPGLIVALLCVFFIYKKNYITVSILALLTGAGSLLAQSVTAFCPYCTIAAVLFILGGLCSVIINPPSLRVSLFVIGVTILCLSLINGFLPVYQQSPIVAQEVLTTQAVNDKPKLYISPDCRACKDIIQQFIDNDPEGESWQPVITPTILLARGEHYLREKGYVGEVISAPKSPTQFIPVLQVGEQFYRGKEIHPDRLGGIVNNE